MPWPDAAGSVCAIPAGGCRSIPGSCSTGVIPWCAGSRIGIVGTVVVMFVVCSAVVWRLTSGPISLDVATPWLTAAIESNFGSRYRVQVGGTQLERDDNGRTALRLRDIAVRDANGALVASAPKAEVGIAGTSLLMGSPARHHLPPGRRHGGDPHRGRWPRQRVRRRRSAARHHRAGRRAATARSSAGVEVFAPGRWRSAASPPTSPPRWPGSTASAAWTRRQVARCHRVRRQGPDRNRSQQRQPHRATTAVTGCSGASSSSPSA